MTQQFKKTDRKYVLSDSTVNEYGFRLLTSGYQIEEFRKNPIGYYMHRREEGVVVKWEDLSIEDDKIVGIPVVNLSHEKGVQISEEVENGFLNAASVGHIVVLEYSMEKELMLPGQTGPTVTKWYNKECSLVDIPGNSNALTDLYDDKEQQLNVQDLCAGITNSKLLAEEIRAILQIPNRGGLANITLAIAELKQTNVQLTAEKKVVEKQYLEARTELEALQAAAKTYEIRLLLDRALEDKKITVEMSRQLAKDYSENSEGLSKLLQAMPQYRTIADQLKTRSEDATEQQWGWDDYEKNDPSGNKLKKLRADDPVRYKELFENKFAA